MRWRPGIRRRRVLSRKDPRFLVIKALELKGRAERLSNEADRLYECAWELQRDRRVKEHVQMREPSKIPRAESSASYFYDVPTGLGRS